MNDPVRAAVAAVLFVAATPAALAVTGSGFAQSQPSARTGAPLAPTHPAPRSAPGETRGNVALPPNHYFERRTDPAARNGRPVGTWRLAPPAPGYHRSPRSDREPGMRRPAQPGIAPVNGRSDRSIAGTARSDDPARNIAQRPPQHPRNGRPAHRIDPGSPHAARDSSGIRFGPPRSPAPIDASAVFPGPIPRTSALIDPQVPYSGNALSSQGGRFVPGPVRIELPVRLTPIRAVPFATVPDFIIEPLRGQDEAQLLDDRSDCIDTASDASGFDPSLIDGGLRSRAVHDGQLAFDRAFGECLLALGYQLR